MIPQTGASIASIHRAMAMIVPQVIAERPYTSVKNLLK
jgi:hypothetical protein